MEPKPKILMLGWEFPPVINGGLGVACHDLCQSLTSLAKVIMIIPKNTSGFKMKNCELVGMNSLNTTALPAIPAAYGSDFFEDVNYIQADFDPYYSESARNDDRPLIIGHADANENEGIRTETSFEIDELYGNDLIEKVKQFARLATQFALTKEFDVIHAHDWMTMIAGMKIKKLTGKPLVVHIHSLEIDRSGNDSGRVFDLEKAGMEDADLIMPVSDFTGDIIQKYYGISREKIVTIHNGIRPVKAFRSEKPFKEKLVVFVGRLTRQKGPSKLVDIASKVIQNSPDVRFAAAGTGDKLETMLEQSSAYGIGNRFHLTGFQTLEHIHYLLSMADAYCMPSVSEPFGLSAVEAVQFGVPCIISKQSGVSEVLHGAMKFDYWDVDRAAGYIINVLNNDVLKKKIVEDAFHDLKQISWELSAKKVIDAYADFNLI